MMVTPNDVAVGDNRLFVADTGNNRVLIFDVTSITNGEAAVGLLGQSDYTYSVPAVTQTGMNVPIGVGYNETSGQLFVGEYSNNRVLVFSVARVSANNVSTTVDPSFSFAVANQASACNDESNFASSAGTATAVALGHLAMSSNVSGGQALSISSNTGNGFSVYIRGTQASQNLRSSGHNWTDVAGTYASPASLGAGRTLWLHVSRHNCIDVSYQPRIRNFAAVNSATTNKIMGSTTSQTGAGCVSFDVQTGSTTPAGSYTATIIYTAVPVF